MDRRKKEDGYSEENRWTERKMDGMKENMNGRKMDGKKKEDR